MKFILTIITLHFIICGCTVNDTSQDDKLYIVSTTGMIDDIVSNLCDSTVKHEALMGPGVDPHLYKAKPSDLKKLQNADIIFYNGLHLEGKMSEVLEKLSKSGKKVFAVSEGLKENDLIKISNSEIHDPHIWFNVELWIKATDYIYSKLKSESPTQVFDEYHDSFKTELTSLHNYVKQEISSIPDSQRVLITAHDAFGYFGKAYDIKVYGIQGISTLSDYGLKDLKNLQELIISNNIKAVFVESSVPKRSIEALIAGCESQGHHLTIGGTLYSDAMGQQNTPEGTYIGMVKANINTITKGLK